MSDIPAARVKLEQAVEYDMHPDAKELIYGALNLMFREPPDMIVRDGISRALTKKQTERAKALRKRRHSLAEIALRIGTQTGRVHTALRK